MLQHFPAVFSSLSRHLPVFTLFLNSHPSLHSHSAAPLCFPTYYIRCDAAIAKLSTDVSSGEQQLIGLQQEVAELRSTVDVRLKELEAKVRDRGLGIQFFLMWTGWLATHFCPKIHDYVTLVKWYKISQAFVHTMDSSTSTYLIIKIPKLNNPTLLGRYCLCLHMVEFAMHIKGASFFYYLLHVLNFYLVPSIVHWGKLQVNLDLVKWWRALQHVNICSVILYVLVIFKESKGQQNV